METKSLRASLFRPTTSLSGNEAPSVFRGVNVVLRGGDSNPYFEVFEGNLDLDETYTLDAVCTPDAGTLTFTANSHLVTGTCSVFRSRLHIGQMILCGSQVLVVKEVLTDTTFLADRKPTASGSGTGYLLPQLSEMNGKRLVMLSGNAIELGKGHLVAVGSGTVYVNGEVLAGESLVASNRPKAAIYRPATNNFAITDLGFTDPPPLPTIEVIEGGTKGMVDGNKHSFKFSWWSGSPDGPDGYGPLSEPLKLDINDDPIQIEGTLNKFRGTFTSSFADPPDNAKGLVIWGSQSGRKTKSVNGESETTTSPNETHYENGPWLKVAEIAFADMDGTDGYEFEYLDSDLGAEETGGNDRPPGAEFVTKMEGRPLYLSCYGKATTADGEGSNPGPFVSLSKFANPDAAPAEWAMPAPSGTIIGFFDVQGRTFLMTPGGLDFAFSTAQVGGSTQAGSIVEIPVGTRAYWKTGAANRYSIIAVEDTLYGRSGGKFIRSAGYGDENVTKYDFGGVVGDISRDWSDGHVLTANDPKNTQVCFFHSAAYQNAQGYWVTEILPYSLYNNAWLPTIVLSDPTKDMIVSGVATVDEKLEFLCGGRRATGSPQVRTYRYAAGDTTVTSMPYYLLWQISDDGLENVSKQIHSIRPSGKFTSMKVQIHGAKPGQKISTTNMEDGAATDSGAYFSGDIAFDDTTIPTRYLEKKVRIRDLAIYALRLSGEWDGAGMRDRLEEMVLTISLHGRSR